MARASITPIDMASRQAAFLLWFGLKPRRSAAGEIRSADAEMLSHLFAAQGSHLQVEVLCDLLSMSRGSVWAAVCRLRSMMESEAIDWEKGKGYSLTSIGVDECRRAMRAMARSLAA